jgi:hypothetical protein
VQAITNLVGPGWSYREFLPVALRSLNLAGNPKADNDTSGMSAVGGSGMTGVALSRVVCAWTDADFCFRVTGTKDNSTTARALQLIISPTGVGGIPCEPGDHFSFSADVRSVADTDAGMGYRFLVRYYDAAGVLIASSTPASPEVLLGGTAGTRITWENSLAVPEGAVSMHVRLDLLSNDPLDVMTFEATRIRVERGTEVSEYRDGDSDGWEWLGTPGSSQSRELSEVPAYTVLIELPWSAGSPQFLVARRVIRLITPAHLDLIITSAGGFTLDQSQLDIDTFSE